MKALVLGAGGQLGCELEDLTPSQITCLFLDRKSLDVTDDKGVRAAFETEQPDVVLNAAAYTAVDKAETEQEVAEAVNVAGARNVALACATVGARLLHFSTDFVFDGEATAAYKPDATTHPLGVYGRTKLDGEAQLLSSLPNNALVIRTSWLYSEFGSNFVKTMLRLMSERDSLGVVGDQVGCPTWAKGLARLAWHIAEKPIPPGVYHWSDRGSISWYEFAVAIQEIGIGLGILDHEIPLREISTSDYPTAAVRPKFSVLDWTKVARETGIEPADWRSNLQSMLERVQAQ